MFTSSISSLSLVILVTRGTLLPVFILVVDLCPIILSNLSASFDSYVDCGRGSEGGGKVGGSNGGYGEGYDGSGKIVL